MSNFRTYQELRNFFKEIFYSLRNNNNELENPWIKIKKIGFFENLNDEKIDAIISYFSFLKREKWDHISIDKISFIIESLTYLNHDIKNLSLLLDYSGFEQLINKILNKSGFFTTTNFRFSDKSNYKSKTSQGKYEIDVLALKHKILLIIDAKQWKNKDLYGAMNKAANLQYQRVVAIKNNPIILGNLLSTLTKQNENLKKYLPLKCIPLMITLEENGARITENHIPLVSIYSLNQFLYELDDNLPLFKTEIVKKLSIQKSL